VNLFTLLLGVGRFIVVCGSCLVVFAVRKYCVHVLFIGSTTFFESLLTAGKHEARAIAAKVSSYKQQGWMHCSVPFSFHVQFSIFFHARFNLCVFLLLSVGVKKGEPTGFRSFTWSSLDFRSSFLNCCRRLRRRRLRGGGGIVP
jgi:hypothetical protein